MITQVSGPNISGVTKDPRRKAQSVQFKKHSTIPYQKNYDMEYERQQRNALLSSITIIAGALLFAVGYFVLAGLKSSKV